MVFSYDPKILKDYSSGFFNHIVHVHIRTNIIQCMMMSLYGIRSPYQSDKDYSAHFLRGHN